jgi:acyl carrier protein phosphodiesterase
MNFLAHLWLADRAGADFAGAVLGDWLRGPVPGHLPPPLALSVRLHRRIDAETDRHPLVLQARRRFGPGARRYAGILLDLLYDHLLARHWPEYSDEPLDTFADRAAREVAGAQRWFRDAGGPAPEALRFSALLTSYRSPGGLEQAARRTAQRLRQPDGLLQALAGWERQLPPLQEELPGLLRELEQLSRDFLAGGFRPVSR